jgi:hypothetical protein
MLKRFALINCTAKMISKNLRQEGVPQDHKLPAPEDAPLW